MTQQEKELLARVYRCVNRLATVGPRNPADIAGLAKADCLVSQNAPRVASAISSLGYGDWELCADYLGDAETGLGVKS